MPVHKNPGIFGSQQPAGFHHGNDRFVGVQLNFEKQLLGNWEALNYNFRRIEEIFNEAGDYGLSGAMDEFWNAWQALADNPSGQAERAEHHGDIQEASQDGTDHHIRNSRSGTGEMG